MLCLPPQLCLVTYSVLTADIFFFRLTLSCHRVGCFFILGDRKPLGICSFSHSFEEWACIILETGIDHGREIDDWHPIFALKVVLLRVFDYSAYETEVSKRMARAISGLRERKF